VPDQPQPRRRISDKDRRRWSDARLNDRHQVIDRRLDKLEAFERVMAQVPGLMNGIQEQLEETQKDVREMRARMDKNFDRNFREHESVQATADEIAAQVKPTRMSKVKDFAGYVSALVVPFVLAYLTYVLARGGKP
jgi:ABC-type transporter Mla subunit MlaD